MASSPSSVRGTVPMVMAMSIAGTIGVFAVESGLPPLLVVFYRCLFGAISLGIYCAARRSLWPRQATARTLALIAIGGACLVFNWVLLFEAFHLTTISIATIVYHVNPFILLVLGALVFHDPVGRAKIMWTLFAFAGLVLVVGLPVEQADGYVLGVMLALTATFLYSWTVVIAKWLSALPPELVAFLQVALGAVLLLPIAEPWETPADGAHWPYLIALGVIHTGVMYALLYAAFQRLSMPLIAILSFIYPVVAVILDDVIYGHVLDTGQWIGVTIIAAATIAVRLDWDPLSRSRKALP